MGDMIQHVGRLLVITGVVIALLGALLLLFRHSGVPFLGKLPGDIMIQKKGFTFYFPITTCIILSILLSLILYLIMGRK